MSGRKYSVPSLVANLLIFVVIIGILISIGADISEIENQPPSDGVDLSGLSIAILTIVAILVLIYGGIILVVLALKIAHVATDKWGFAIPCLIIDLVVFVINAALVISAVSENGVGGIALGGGLVILSVVSIASNVLSIAKRDG